MPLLPKAVMDTLGDMPNMSEEITNRLDRIIVLLEELVQQQG